MSTKATFWFAVVALVAFGSAAVAVPLTANDAGATVGEDQKAKGSELDVIKEDQKPEGQQDPLDKSTGSSGVPTTVTEESKVGETNIAESQTPSVELKLPMEKADKPELPSDVEIVTKPNQEGSKLPINRQGSNQGQNPRPYYTSGVQPMNMGPAIPPFFLEFFQPFQPFQGPPPPRFHQQSQNPFATSNDQFDPFMNPMRIPSFDQLVNSYTNEFRTPGVIILKPKRNVVPNTSSMAIPPIPLLMNIMLNAFRQHPPTDMLESLEKSMVQMDNADAKKEGPTKPVGKTTTKTEIIDGHVVQTDETTYTGGDENHKTFYHIKEIKVLPENSNKKIISNEQVVSSVKDDSELQKEETNEIKNNLPVSDLVAQHGDGEKNDQKKAPGSVSLDEHFQTAAATYYAPYAPYGPRPAVYYPRPSPHYGAWYPPANYGGGGGRPPVPPAPISLHGDTYVNQLAAAQQQASGAHAMLPPDVELIDVHGKPLQGGGGGGSQYFYNNRQHPSGHDKFPGRKN